MRALLILALPFALAACVPDNLAALETVPATVVPSANAWQATYRTLNAQLHACASTGGVFPVGVDGQLYADYGEILVTYAQGPFSNTSGPVAQVQVRPAATGSSVQVRAARNPIGARVADMTPRWVAGDTRCR